MQTEIPCVIMRGGTSRGPYFQMSDLPTDRNTLTDVLLAVMGSPDKRQIDGLGGAQWLTSKVAIVGPSSRTDADVDFLFAQVIVDRNFVDFAPNCGNLTSGVGPFAIDSGMVSATRPETNIQIYNINTGAIIDAKIQTPNGSVKYDGEVKIDGVPGGAAPIMLYFRQMIGSKTGKLLPTGRLIDTIDGVDVSCVDAAIPMVIIKAGDMGKTGYESKAELDSDDEFFTKLETIRSKASFLMGLGDPKGSVIPKFCMLSDARTGGSVNARYFVPTECHANFPLVGGMCLAAASVIKGSIVDQIRPVSGDLKQSVLIEHPMGQLETFIECDAVSDMPDINRIGFIRTARRIMTGHTYIPPNIWNKNT